MTTRWITTVSEMQAFRAEVCSQGKSLALVPTMGALHEGHLSLVGLAGKECDAVVVSIFVNPAQFRPGEDFGRYPRTPEKDLESLRPFEVDAVFAPDSAEMYPAGFTTFVDPGPIVTIFEGAIRPGHFRGVATVVLKLFNIVRPDVAIFGQKDFQQVAVIRQMVDNLNLQVRIRVAPIVRDADGMAKSSRNAFLNKEDRKAALALSRSLRRAEEMFLAGEHGTQEILEEIRGTFDAEPSVELNYAVIVNPSTLKPVAEVSPGSVGLVAARAGAVHLIDNLIFGPPGSTPDQRLQIALVNQPVSCERITPSEPALDNLRAGIEHCRDCAAISSVSLPPREFLVKHLGPNDPIFESTRTLVVGRCAPINPDRFLYCNPDAPDQFAAGLYNLLGVKNFEEFKTRFALTDAARCHARGIRINEKVLELCARHLRKELEIFPNLESIIILGEDAYDQFQRHILGRNRTNVKPFRELLKSEGWAEETVSLPSHAGRTVRVFYCFHPTFASKRSPSIARFLG